MDRAPGSLDDGDVDGRWHVRPSVPDRPARGPGCYTPREYERRSPGRNRRSADRGHDLRELCQPDRALPAQDAGRRRTATVNLATEVATIRYLPDLAGRAELVGAIEAAGYDAEAGARGRASRPPRGRSARPPTPTPPAAHRLRVPPPPRGASSRSRVAVAIMVAMFWPQTVVADGGHQPARSCVPATFIQFWAGRRFYAAAWRAGRHGGLTMDTLVVDRHDRRLGVQRVRDALPRGHPRGRPPPGDLLRQLDDHHRPRPARPLARGAGEGPRRRVRSGGSSASSPTTARLVRGHDEVDVPVGVGRAGRPAPRPARRPGAGRRHRRRGRVRGRRVDAHRRGDGPSSKRPGDEVIGATRQHDRVVPLPGDARRRRHGAGPDRRPRRAGPGLARRRSSGSPTGSARSSCRPSSLLAVATFVGVVAVRPGAAADARADRVHRRRRSSPARARWASPRRPRSWSGPGAAPRPGSCSAAARRSRRPSASTSSSSTRPAR